MILAIAFFIFYYVITSYSIHYTKLYEDFSAVAGYYDPDWHAAVEFGFDKAVATQLTHSDVMKQFGFAGIRDGWYVPTGGHFYYVITSYSIHYTKLYEHASIVFV